MLDRQRAAVYIHNTCTFTNGRNLDHVTYF